MTGDRDASHRLLGEIERDFEALARLIERAIEHLADDHSATEQLRRAKEAAERGALLARSRRPDDHV